MADFQRTPIRMVSEGLTANRPVDAAPNQFLDLLNTRTEIEGELTVREGTILQTSVPDAVHSLARLDDPTPFNGGVPAVRVVGAGSSLYLGPPLQNPLPSVDTGYSGDPLVLIPGTPIGTPQPWLYVTDRSRMRKVNTQGQVRGLGLAAPTTYPSAALTPPLFTVIGNFDGLLLPWADVPVGNAGVAFQRVNTTITAILYDSGTSGQALVALAGLDQITAGMLLTLGGVEIALVQDVRPVAVNTTVAAILYDSGTTGYCTIQPAASLGSGQIQVPSPPVVPSEPLPGLNGLGVPATPFGVRWPLPDNPDGLAPAQFLTTRNFPVDCLIRIDGATQEYVRILSAVTGPDGVQSFRCYTTNPHGVGENVVGIVGLRMATTLPFAVGDTVTSQAYKNNLTTPSDADTVGGIAAVGLVDLDLTLIGGRATQPDDWCHLSLRIDRLDAVEEIRILFDLEDTFYFQRDYYLQVFTANDLVKTIQTVNGSGDPIATTTLVNAQENTAIQRLATQQNYTGPGALQGAQAIARQLGLGNNQWMNLRWRLREMTHFGTDPTKTLAKVTAAAIYVQYSGLAAGGYASAVQVSYADLYLTGGYGPDASETLAPYTWAYRYRSKVTGEVSNPSPEIPGFVDRNQTGQVPTRQQVTLTGKGASAADVDTVDWFRNGGSLPGWTFVGSQPNAAGNLSYVDNFADKDLVGGQETLEFDNFQLWPSTDQPRRGICNVAGNMISWVSGDTFNAKWAPGSVILVNGIATSIFQVVQSGSPTLLMLADNVGAFTNVPFELPDAMLLQTNLPCFWGPFEGFYFGCGDPNAPNLLVWTKGNNPDTASDKSSLLVTGAEALVNGCVYDGVPFVWSTEELYRIRGPYTEGPTFRVEKTACGRGLWARWAWTLSKYGIIFLAKDGIYVTSGGSAAQALTTDLYRIFPHDGVPGQSVRYIGAPDMSQLTELRLACVDDLLYFDYAAFPPEIV